MSSAAGFKYDWALLREAAVGSFFPRSVRSAETTFIFKARGHTHSRTRVYCCGPIIVRYKAPATHNTPTQGELRLNHSLHSKTECIPLQKLNAYITKSK